LDFHFLIQNLVARKRKVEEKGAKGEGRKPNYAK